MMPSTADDQWQRVGVTLTPHGCNQGELRRTFESKAVITSLQIGAHTGGGCRWPHASVSRVDCARQGLVGRWAFPSD